MPEDDNWKDFRYVLYGYTRYASGRYAAWLDPSRQQFDDTYSNNILEYWDKTWYMKEENGKTTEQVKHDLGFIPWVVVKNMPVPHNLSSEGDFQHSVAMQEYLNEQLLMQGKVIFDFANAPIVVNGSRSTQVNFNERVWDLGPDGRATFLTYPGNSPSQETLYIKTQQGFEDGVGVTSPALGRDIPSGTTGPVISSLLGGFSGILSMKQMMVAYGLYQVNLILQQMAEMLYPNMLFPTYPSSGFSYAKTTQFSQLHSIRPIEFGGFYGNSIEFPEDERIKSMKANREVELMRLGLQSKLTTMRKIGIENPLDEMQQIMKENPPPPPVAQPIALEPGAPQQPATAPTPEQLEAIEAMKQTAMFQTTAAPASDNGKKKSKAKGT